jgi:para-nitrobenzyl esterase
VPSAKGLFHRGIIQSGARLVGMPLAAARANAATILERLGVSTIEQLQALPFEQVLAAVTTTGRTDPALGPVVDGSYLPADMFDPVPAPTAHGIPLVVGSNRDEHALYVRDAEGFGEMTKEELRADLASFGDGARVDELVAAYRESRPDATPWDLMIAIRSNRFHVGTMRLAESASKVSPVYVYSFDFEPTERLGAAHGAEIAFVFGNATANPQARPDAKAVEDAMCEAWIAFARTGSPNHPGIPEWPTYDAEQRRTLVFDLESRVVADPRASERKVWEDRELVR